MPGSNNFIQHNPTEANQDDNATFIADSLTSGGIGLDATMPHGWLNKRWYQDSTMVTALGMMMAAKGYVISDADINVLAATLAHIITDADLKTPLVSVAYSPTPTFDATNANGFDMVLGANVTSSSLVNVAIGQTITFVITQSAGGGLTFVPPANINGWRTINAAPNSVTVQQFIRDSNGDIMPLVPLVAGLTMNDVTGSRSFGNPFVAAKDTRVTVSALLNFGPGNTATIRATVNGVKVATSSITNSSGFTSISFSVPAGGTTIVSTGGIGPGDNRAATLDSWVEWS